MVPRTLAALALLAVLTALAGCSGDPEPKLAPTPSPSVSSPVPPPSVTPVAETPEAFIKRWAAAEVTMQNSGDTASYRALAPSCKSCRDLADQIEDYYAQGGYVRFGGQTVKSVVEVARNADRIVVRVRVAAQPTEYKKSAASDVESFPGGPTTYKMTLLEKDGQTTLLEYTRLAT